VDGWLSPLDKALYPARDQWRISRPAEGCPKFGQSSVLDRPRDYDGNPEASVRPGLISPQVGSHSVVWWDPFQLRLGAEADYGLQQEGLLKDDGGASAAAYESWRDARAAMLRDGSLPSVEVFTGSEATELPPTVVPIEFLHIGESRKAGGRRFGVLVHAVLRDVELDTVPDSISRVVAMHTRILGATQEEAEAAIAAVDKTLQHDVIKRARASVRYHREYPISLRVGGRLLEGVIDLAFIENGKWIVVDFKTDADTSIRREQYERQLQWYAYALQQLTDMSARAVLLEI
jgi:ATP-dependent helicase/nuclease subunit A